MRCVGMAQALGSAGGAAGESRRARHESVAASQAQAPGPAGVGGRSPTARSSSRITRRTIGSRAAASSSAVIALVLKASAVGSEKARRNDLACALRKGDRHREPGNFGAKFPGTGPARPGRMLAAMPRTPARPAASSPPPAIRHPVLRLYAAALILLATGSALLVAWLHG